MNRIKVSGTRAYYHAMTRTVNGEQLLDGKAKEILRRSLWRSARFCEVRLLTYCIMDNHFHVLLGIDPVPQLSDSELIDKVMEFYDHPGEEERRAVMIGALRAGGERAQRMRELLQARMGDISAYMKTVKQRLSCWYNREHGRFGTLYAERYRSVLLEGGAGNALLTVAAYIALNPIRAGLVKRPEGYRSSGYAEAMAGGVEALAGLMEMTGAKTSQEALQAFRQCLYGKGGMPKSDGSGGGQLDSEVVAKVLREGGAVSGVEALHCRIRYLTDGLILGREEYVAGMLDRLRKSGMNLSEKYVPRLMNGASDWGPMAVMRRLRGNIYGMV